jgi:hypothetical protein
MQMENVMSAKKVENTAPVEYLKRDAWPDWPLHDPEQIRRMLGIPLMEAARLKPDVLEFKDSKECGKKRW